MTLVFSGIIKVAVGVADNTYRDFDCSGYHKNNCITRNTCIAEPREGRGREARKLSAMGWRERNRVSCLTGEGGFQQRL